MQQRMANEQMRTVNRNLACRSMKMSRAMTCLQTVLLVATFCIAARAAAQQVVRLPTVVPLNQSTAARLASYPGSAAELVQAPGQLEIPTEPERPPGARSGMFQKLLVTGTWLAPGGGDNFGMSELEIRSILALPIPSREYPLIITPGFGVHYIDGPVSSDLPPRVYDAYVQFRWMRRLGSRWGIDLAVTPGLFSDFQQSSDDAFRVTGYGAAQWTRSETQKFVFGVAYIDRQTTDLLPICGIIWTPHDGVRFDLVFPHPRIGRRIYLPGHYGEDVQHWIYMAAELGGGTWAVRRTAGFDDQVDYSDYRIFFGIERKAPGRLDSRFEIGYVFNREVRYESATPRIEPDGTVMVRGGLTY